MKTLALLLLAAATAHAEPRVLRIASVAPDGTPWARELKAFAREVEVDTHGEVRVKLYLGGIVGDELEVMGRIEREQMDGQIAGGVCTRLAPSLGVLMLPGLFQNRAEAAFVVNQLRARLEAEAMQRGYVLLGDTGLGPQIILSRTPIRSLLELRAAKLWKWQLEEVGVKTLERMGIGLKLTTSLNDAADTYDRGVSNGFLAAPTAALAYQWSVRARYFTDLRTGYLTGCSVVASRAFDRISVENQRILRSLTLKLEGRMEEIGARVDEALLGGLFQKQGLVAVKPSESFRADFFEAARTARETVGTPLVAPELLQRVTALLADYRAEHAR
jgi:TRAP-type C4-dicarboxylate transport system substrate-binding protein